MPAEAIVMAVPRGHICKYTDGLADRCGCRDRKSQRFRHRGIVLIWFTLIKKVLKGHILNEGQWLAIRSESFLCCTSFISSLFGYFYNKHVLKLTML